MIKLTQPDKQPMYVDPAMLGAIVPTATGCRIFGVGWNAEVTESALHVYQQVKRAKKRSVRDGGVAERAGLLNRKSA